MKNNALRSALVFIIYIFSCSLWASNESFSCRTLFASILEEVEAQGLGSILPVKGKYHCNLGCATTVAEVIRRIEGKDPLAKQDLKAAALNLKSFLPEVINNNDLPGSSLVHSAYIFKSLLKSLLPARFCRSILIFI